MGSVGTVRVGPAPKGTLTSSAVAPRVIASSIQEGNGVAPGTVTENVTFSEPMATANIDSSDFTLSAAIAAKSYAPSSFSFNTAGTTLTITYANLPEDHYKLTLKSGFGAFQDTAGNYLDGEPVWPLPAAGSGDGVAGGDFYVDFSVDVGTVVYSGPLTARAPLGSQVYDGSIVGAIDRSNDTDTYAISLVAGEVLSVDMHPTSSGLLPQVALLNPDGSAAAAIVKVTTPGVDGIAMTDAVSGITTGTYLVQFGGASSTVGLYSATFVLNASIETEGRGGATNDTLATAQSLAISTHSVASRTGSLVTAVEGTTDAGTGAGALANEVEPNDSAATANNASSNFLPYTTSNLYQLGLSGQVSTAGDADWYGIGALQPGDVLTVSASGYSGFRGTLQQPALQLYRAGASAAVASDRVGGPGADSLIYRFTITTNDTYYIRVASVSATAVGGYQIGAYLENSGPPPLTGGSVTTESEPNDAEASATDASTSWRAVQYRSDTAASLPSLTDVDYYAFSFAAGDLVTVDAREAGASNRLGVQILNSAKVVVAQEDGTSSGMANDSYEYSYTIPAAGTYYVCVRPFSGTNSYTLDVYLSTSTTPPTVQAGTPDYYSVTLSKGQALNATLSPFTPDTITLNVLSDAGVVYSTKAATGSNYGSGISDFVAPYSGVYSLRVQGNRLINYNLVATIGAGIDSEPNDSLATAQSINGTRIAIGALSGSDDYYSFQPGAGVLLSITTLTPASLAGLFVNTLDPRLELYDPSNTLVASDDNSSLDGRNASLTYLTQSAGVYTVRVAASGGTSGEYVLNASGVLTGGAPTQPDLLDASDSGISSHDNVTNFNNASPATAMQFVVGNTLPGATVTLYRGDVPVGSALATTGTTLITTSGALAFIDGVYAFTARQTPPGQPESADSDPLNVTIDTSPPAPPSSFYLWAGSDSGFSSSDGVTNVMTPAFITTGVTYYRVYRDGAEVGPLYQWAYPYTPSPLADGTYAFSATAIDVAGNESTPVKAGSLIVNTTPPVAAATLPNQTTASSTYQFNVTYTDAVANDAASIDSNDVSVGATNFAQNATLVSLDAQSNGPTRVATYQISAPNGTWPGR